MSDPRSNLKQDIKKAIQLLQENKLEKAGHQLKDISIKAYYSSKDSEVEQKWLNLHKTMSMLGHAFLKKDAGSRQYVDRHRDQALDILEGMLDGDGGASSRKTYSYSESDHKEFLKDKVAFLEKELEKSQKQVLELQKEVRSMKQEEDTV